jgi:two-component system LytT family sensor kinase
VLSYQCTTFPTFSFLVLAVALSAIILSKMRDLRKEKEQADRLLIQYQSIKQESLKEQIKPHFIFNYLTAIENNYHKDLASGDEAMEQFAQHLRSNVDSMGRDLIPFEDELKNILNYVDLEAITEKRIVFFGFEEDHPVVASVRIRVE